MAWHLDSSEPYIKQLSTEQIDGKEEITVILTLFERPFTSQKARLRNISSKAVVKDLNLKHGVLISIEGSGQN